MRFLPGSSTTIFTGNDGGLFKSTNSGATWTSLNKGLAITQFYGVGISKTNPTIMVMGAQDNGNMKYSAGTITNITNADGMRGFVDWSDANTLYVSIQYGDFFRSTNGGTTFTPINTPSAGAWNSPWMQDPKVATTIYAGTDKVYKSTNQGTTWTTISGALEGVSTFEVLGVAPSDPMHIYAGNGTKLYHTANGGDTWKDVTAGLLRRFQLPHRDCHQRHRSEYRVCNIQRLQFRPGRCTRSTDGGAGWANVSGTLPNMPADAIVHENNANDSLYVGTDAGVYYRDSTLADWVPYKSGLPNVIVDQLEIHYATKVIRAATYGRGAWEAPLK